MPNRNAFNTPASPPKVEAQGHQKNPKAHTVHKDPQAPRVPGYAPGHSK